MARSKAFLFESDEQLGSRLNFALAHPARLSMMARLLQNHSISYLDLIAGIPLVESAIARHIRLLEREGFLEPSILEDGRTGYRLKRKFYHVCAAASRRVLTGVSAQPQPQPQPLMRYPGKEVLG